MKKSIQLFAFCCVVFLLSSCNKNKSLQEYLIESQDKSGFIALDVPTSFLELKNEDASEEVRATLKSIRKVSVVALPYKGNEDAYDIEKNNIKKVFKDNDDYTSLMMMKVKGMNMNVFYTGETDAIDEIIVFGYGKEAGVGIARLLGDDMNLGKIMGAINEIKLDPGKLQLEKFAAIFSGK